MSELKNYYVHAKTAANLEQSKNLSEAAVAWAQAAGAAANPENKQWAESRRSYCELRCTSRVRRNAAC